MSIFKMEKMTWKEVESLDKDKTVALVALSPIEEHGPHLPLGTDYISARELLNAVVNNLEIQNENINYLIHPSFPLGYNECVMNYPGTISFRAETVKNVIVDFGESISRSGFKKMVILNYHLDLGHIKAILSAANILEERCALKVLEAASSIIYSGEEGEASKEIHADFRETSFMLYKYPELVKECYKNLEPVYLDVEQFVKNGGRCWRQYGIKDGYIGSPAKATKESGKIQFRQSVECITELIMNFIERDYIPELSNGIKTAMSHMRLR